MLEFAVLEVSPNDEILPPRRGLSTEAELGLPATTVSIVSQPLELSGLATTCASFFAGCGTWGGFGLRPIVRSQD